MPNRNYERGVRFEREVKAMYEASGFLVLRTAGSHGPFDLVIVKADKPVQLVQCKVLKDGDEKAAYYLLRKFKHDPPIATDRHYEQVMMVRIKDGKILSEVV